MVDSQLRNSPFAKLAVAMLIAIAVVCLWLVKTQAAPINAENQKGAKFNKTNEPIFASAKYANDTNALSALVVRSDPNDPKSPPIVVLVARIDAQVVMPGTAVPQEASVVAYMYLEEKDLSSFPSALKVVKRSVIDGYPIDVNNPARGLSQIRRAYRRAFDSGKHELDLSSEKE